MKRSLLAVVTAGTLVFSYPAQSQDGGGGADEQPPPPRAQKQKDGSDRTPPLRTKTGEPPQERDRVRERTRGERGERGDREGGPERRGDRRGFGEAGEGGRGFGGDGSGGNDADPTDKLIDELRRLSPKEQEERINKAPEFVRGRLRERLRERQPQPPRLPPGGADGMPGGFGGGMQGPAGGGFGGNFGPGAMPGGVQGRPAGGGVGGRGGGMMLPGANTGLPRMPSPYDPEMTEIMQQESMLERESFEIASLLQRAKNDQERTEAREKLKKVVVKHFDIRQKRRELELARLEKEIEKIKQEVQRRKDRKDALIEARIGQLIGDDSGF